jgi:hypothetical protein
MSMSSAALTSDFSFPRLLAGDGAGDVGDAGLALP